MSGSGDRWFAIVQTLGIVTSFLFTAYQVRKSRTSGVAANEIRLIELHRDLWKLTIEHPELMRPFSHNVDAGQLSLSPREHRFVNLLFLHISGAYALTETGEVRRMGDFRGDLGELLAYPAIRKFWEENKRLYDAKFVVFVDSCTPRLLNDGDDDK